MSTNRRQKSREEMDNASGQGQSQELHKLFLDELADLYNAEQQLTKALPKMVKAAQSTDLRQAFESHLEETRTHVTRLEKVATSLGESLGRKKCKAMEGLIEEAGELMQENEDSSVLDAALIAAAQKVEHYEIASYGTVCSWAESMGHHDALTLLKETLDEEKAADEKLTEIAESEANQAETQNERGAANQRNY